MQKDKTIEELKDLVNKFKNERLGFVEDQKKLSKLYEMGVIDSQGDLIPFLPEVEDEMK